MLKSFSIIFALIISLIYSNQVFSQKALNVFYISGSVNDNMPELRIAEKLYDQFSGLRKQLKNETVFAYFNNKHKPVTIQSFQDEGFRPFFDAINDSMSKENPIYKSVNFTYRYFLYKQENNHAFDNIKFHFFMSNNAMENIASDPEATVYSLPAELLQVLGTMDAQASVIIYYDKSKLKISEDAIMNRLAYYKNNENISFLFKPL